MPLRRTPTPTTRDTHAVAPEDFVPFDTPSTDEVLQAEPPYEPGITSLPVHLVDVAQVEQRPTEVGMTKSVEVSAIAPELLIPENKRRATVTFWVAVGETVRVAPTAQEATRDDSSLVFVAGMAPTPFHWSGPVYGMKRAAGATTDRFVICTEDWAR